MEKIAAIKRGDVRAFTDVFETFYQKTFSFFMGRTSRNRELAKELTQLTYIKVWQSKHTLSEDHSLDKQLFVIAKCILIDHIRKNATEQTVKKEITRKALSPVPLSDLQPAAFEENDYVSAMLKHLPPARKKIMQMKFIYGYTNREIANLLSISIKTVEDHVTKGLHELRADPKLSVALSVMAVITPILNY